MAAHGKVCQDLAAYQARKARRKAGKRSRRERAERRAREASERERQIEETDALVAKLPPAGEGVIA